jgi:RNA polymerase sigma-70 factor, ECF subfamily
MAERTVTMLLKDWRGGDEAALDELMPRIYTELHKIAVAYMRRERADHTLRPTELVAEAYVRLADNAPDVGDRVHFYGIAARTMRQVLVDHARKHVAEKRGSGEAAGTLDEMKIAGSETSADLLSLHEALEALAKHDERKVRILELHYFGGLTQDEIAIALDVHINTVARDIKLGQAWLHRHLST